MTTASVVPTGPSPDAPGAPGTAKTAGLAVASLVAGILGLCTAGLGGIAGLILGIIALKKIGRSGGALRGRGLAIAGLIVSVCTILVWVVVAVVLGVCAYLVFAEERPAGYQVIDEFTSAVAEAPQAAIDSEPERPAGAALSPRPRTLQELAGFLAPQLPAGWCVERNNGVTVGERDAEGNWKWNCILINNPKNSEAGRRIAQEMGARWSSRQFAVMAQGDVFILIAASATPEVRHVAEMLSLTALDPPKDIKTFLVEDCGLVWN